jgi:hypothetical protein
MEHQFFIRQQNLKLYRNLLAASEAAAAKADARQEKLLKLLAEEVANEPPPRLGQANCFSTTSSVTGYMPTADTSSHPG